MSPDELQAWLQRPTETLQRELKSWVGITTPVDKALVARALIALRNRNGGVLAFGFDDKTLLPVEDGRPADLVAAYHPDTLQKLVPDFIEPAFPISVDFVKRDGQEFPVVVVPAGVRSPAMARQGVKNTKGEIVLRQHAVYVRSANNNVVQSTEPQSVQDWDELMEICFNNREADVGRFMRRHLGGVLDELGLKLKSEQAAKVAPAPALPSTPTPEAPPAPASPARSPDVVLDEGATKFAARVAYLRKQGTAIPEQKTWRESAVVLTGPVRPLVGQHILHAVFPRHPQHSGWPLWIDSRNLGDFEKPYPSAGGWEAFVVMNEQAIVKGTMLDFWRIDPRGEFYQRRSLEDDLWPKVPDANRGTTFDIINGIRRVVETLSTVQAFAQGMTASPEIATLKAAFRWTNLRGRLLISMEPGRDFFAPTAAYEDVAQSAVEMPLQTAPGAVASYVNQAVTPLFAAFGYQVPRFVVDELTAKTLNNHMR